MKKFSERSNTEKAFIVIIIILIIGILVRWSMIKPEAEKAFKFFSTEKTNERIPE